MLSERAEKHEHRPFEPRQGASVWIATALDRPVHLFKKTCPEIGGIQNN